MQFMELIQNRKVISIVGMAKNAGKTVTMNRLIDEAVEKQIPVGITSAGRDGEKQDIVTNTEKPLIYIGAGTFIATSEATLKHAEAKLELLEVTEFYTSLGPVVLARAITPGHVQVAGPNTNCAMKAVIDKLLEYGARLVIVDGAIDRRATASPAVTEATILATGAVLSRDMHQVIERSLHQVKLFLLPQVEDETIRELAQNIMEEKGYGIIDRDYRLQPLAIKTALNGGEIIGRALDENAKYVIIGGALVAKTFKQVMATTHQYKNVIFVVKDATRIFIDAKDWIYFTKGGIQVKVIDKMEPLAVTINPYAPQGYYFHPEAFLREMRKFLHPIPVFDVMMGGDI